MDKKNSTIKTSRSLRILLAEDDIINQTYTAVTLEKQGYEVDVVENGKQAIEAYRTGGFDLILMDMQMPEMNGYEAARSIRELEKATGTHIPIIALTARAINTDVEKSLQSDMDGYLSKPFQTNELYDSISQLISDLTKTQEGDSQMETDSNSRQDAEPAYDRAALLKLVGDDWATVDRIVNIFLDQSSGYLNDVRSAVGEGDGEMIRQKSHAIKGVLATLQAKTSYETAKRLEAVGYSDNFDEAPELVKKLESQVEQLVSEFLLLKQESEMKLNKGRSFI